MYSFKKNRHVLIVLSIILSSVISLVYLYKINAIKTLHALPFLAWLNLIAFVAIFLLVKKDRNKLFFVGLSGIVVLLIYFYGNK
jgi:hypothetical protein